MGLWGGVLVVDTTSAVALIEEANRVDLFRTVAIKSNGMEIPDTVLRELVDPLSRGIVKLEPNLSIFDARAIDAYEDLFDRYPRLGPGELGVIAKGIELTEEKTEYTCVLDDGHARSVAERNELSIIGTIGLLIELDEEDVIDRQEHVDILSALQEEGFRYDWENHPLDL